MSDAHSPTKERLRVAVGAGSALVFALAFLNVAFSDSWLEAGASFALGLVSLGVFLVFIGKPRWQEARTNTQLQDPPPAVIRNVDDSTT